MSSEEENLLGSGKSYLGKDVQRYFPVYLYTFGVLFGSLSMGMVIGMSSPMIPDMKKDGTLDDEQSTWFGSLFTLGAMVGGALSGSLINIFGRKLSAITAAIPFVGGLVMISGATDIPLLYSGRIISGVAVGLVSLIVPTYISEIAPKHLRGRLGASHQLIVTIGIFLVYALGIVLHWRWLCIAVAVPPTIMAVFAYFSPETARYLLLKHRRLEAKESLLRLRGANANVDAELNELEDNISKIRGQTVKLSDLVNDRSLSIPLISGLALMFFQQASGINCVMFYSKSIFQEAGISSERMLNIAILMLSLLQIIFTFIACIIIDKTGRKVLLMISSAVMAISLVAFGLYFYLTSIGHEGLSALSLVSLLVYTAAFAIGLGPVPWLMLSEIVPLRAKGIEAGICTAFNWLMAFIITKEFDALKAAITKQGTFWLFGGVCAACVIYTAFLLMETKGKSLEQIEEHYVRKQSMAVERRQSRLLNAQKGDRQRLVV